MLNRMKSFKKKQAISKSNKDELRKHRMFTALFFGGRNVGNRNPQSRGQGISGDTKVVLTQLLWDDKERH